MIPLMPSPGSPKTVSTPQSASRSTSSSAAMVGMVRPPANPSKLCETRPRATHLRRTVGSIPSRRPPNPLCRQPLCPTARASSARPIFERPAMPLRLASSYSSRRVFGWSRRNACGRRRQPPACPVRCASSWASTRWSASAWPRPLPCARSSSPPQSASVLPSGPPGHLLVRSRGPHRRQHVTLVRGEERLMVRSDLGRCTPRRSRRRGRPGCP